MIHEECKSKITFLVLKVCECCQISLFDEKNVQVDTGPFVMIKDIFVQLMYSRDEKSRTFK